MKTESVQELSSLAQLAADYGIGHGAFVGLAILAAMAASAIFATFAQRWI